MVKKVHGIKHLAKNRIGFLGVASKNKRAAWPVYALLSGILPGLALAEQSPPLNIAPASNWSVLVSPYLWGASLNGNMKLAGKKHKIDMPFSEIASHLDSVFMGNIELTNHRWGGYLDVVHVDTDQNEQVLGQAFNLAVRQTTVAAGGFYRAYEYELPGTTVFGEARHIALDPVVGVRWTKIGASVKNKPYGIRMSKEARWTDPFLGARLSIDLSTRWNWATLVELGGMDTGGKKSSNINTYLGYRAVVGNYPVIFRLGYRSLKQRYTSTDFTGHTFKYDIRQSGPVAGLTVRF